MRVIQLVHHFYLFHHKANFKNNQYVNYEKYSLHRCNYFDYRLAFRRICL